MNSPTFERVVEATSVALVLPALAFSVATLNPLVGVWIAGVSLLHVILLALPAFLVLRRFGWVNIVTSTITGLLVGTVPAAIFFSDIPGQFIPFACFGMASGFLFGAWLWVRARPSSNPSITSSTDSDVVLAHKHSSSHRDQLFASQTCGCFYCLRVFSPGKITDWVDFPADAAGDGELDVGTTALCPYCGIDSVIGDTSGFPITRDFLKQMNRHWFASSK